ncbi:MAG: hypothetical protein KDI61_13100 [Alphaproteobacteria bacterium]|nr:hypothetical protein [Alphaproteobacteria bacterium]
MVDFNLKREMLDSLMRGEPIQTLRFSLPDLIDFLHDVNVLSSTDGISDEARVVTDKATLEAVQRLAQEAEFNDSLADLLIFSLIGMCDAPKRQEAFETVFSYLSPEGQIDLLNEMRDQLEDTHDWSAESQDQEVTGLLAKHIRPGGGQPVTVGEVLRSEAHFTLGPGNTILFRPRDEGGSDPGPQDFGHS